MEKTANELRAAYLRQWRAKNPEKTRQYKKRYWEKKAAMQNAKEKEGGNNAVAENKTRN